MFFNYECRITNVELRITNVEFRITNVEFRITNVEFRITNVEFRITNVEFRITNVEMRLLDRKQYWESNRNIQVKYNLAHDCGIKSGTLHLAFSAKRSTPRAPRPALYAPRSTPRALRPALNKGTDPNLNFSYLNTYQTHPLGHYLATRTIKNRIHVRASF